MIPQQRLLICRLTIAAWPGSASSYFRALVLSSISQPGHAKAIDSLLIDYMARDLLLIALPFQWEVNENPKRMIKYTRVDNGIYRWVEKTVTVW